MRETGLTKQERYLIHLLRWWAFLFTICGIGFAIFPDRIITALNTVGNTIFGSKAPPVAPSSERFWLVLTVSLMSILVIASIKAQLNIVKNLTYVKIIIIAKVVSSIGFLICFISLEHSFAYLAGLIIDGFILIITWAFYRRAYRSRYIS